MSLFNDLPPPASTSSKSGNQAKFSSGRSSFVYKLNLYEVNKFKLLVKAHPVQCCEKVAYTNIIPQDQSLSKLRLLELGWAYSTE